jgi:mannosyltransferase
MGFCAAPNYAGAVRGPEPGARGEVVALAALIALGALLRFANLGDQSYWFDETVTVEVVAPHRIGGMFDALRSTESTPPLYYLVAWVWTRVFGDGEWGLRSLSALAGTGAIPIAWAAARYVTSRRGALAAAALVAANPMLVWYSQEARAYSLLVLAGAVSLWLCLRAREAPSVGRLAVWGLSAGCALATHYFALFVIAAEAAVLVPAFRRRPAGAALAAAATGAMVALLIPLASDQGAGDRTSWIATIPLSDRAGDVFRELFSANASLVAVNAGRPRELFGVVGFAAVLAALALLAWRLDREERTRGWPVAVVAAAGIAVPLVLALVDWHDFFLDRNLLAAAVPLAVCLGVVVGARRAGWSGVGLTALACLAGVAANVEIARHGALQRADWRGLSRALGPPDRERVLAVIPGFAYAPLRVYGQTFGPISPDGIRVRELDFLGNYVLGVGPAPTSPPGFRLVERRQLNQVALTRFRAPRYVLLTPALLAAHGFPTDGLVGQFGPETQRWVAAYGDLSSSWAWALHQVPEEGAGDAAAGRLVRPLLDPQRAVAPLEPVPAGVPHGPRLLRLATAASTAGARWAQAVSSGSADAATTARLRVAFTAAVQRASSPTPADLGPV